MDIKKVGVVGCGIMGAGIVETCARSGYKTVALEINDQLLKKGLGALTASLTKGVERGKVTAQDKDATLSRIQGTTNFEDFKDCDLVVEAAIENMEEKKRIFANLDRVCPPHAILGTNTSCLSIIDMAKATKRPAQVLGLHFFNPVPVMKLLEIVTTIATSQDTLNTSKAFGTTLGKTIITAKDYPGFIVNRILIPFLLESVRVLEAGLATREEIDQGIVLGLNHPMGPLTLLDLVGIDTTLYICDAMYDEFKDPRWAAPLLMRKMVTAGWSGRKTGKGFYDYSK